MSEPPSLYEECATVLSDGDVIMDADSLLCVSKRFTRFNDTIEIGRKDRLNWLLLFSGFLVFFMQSGFAMVCAGSVRKKNLQNTMLKNLLDVCIAVTTFLLVGYGLAYRGSGTKKTFVSTSSVGQVDDGDLAFWFLQFSFSASSITIVAGTIAERARMISYALYSVLLGSVVYPVVVHAMWSERGILSAFAADPLGGIGAIDFAGSGVVHLTGGTAALVAAVVLGPRKGRFYDSDNSVLSVPADMRGHSTALQLLGTLILWFGWYGFNCGSALVHNADYASGIAARVALNTSISASAGALTAMLSNAYFEMGLIDELALNLTVTMNGALAGLVAITSACGTVEMWAAVVIGVVSGLLFVWGRRLLVLKKIDDVVEGIPVHLINGIWGMISTGLFSAPGPTKEAFGTNNHVGWFYSLGRLSFDATLFLNQFLAVLFIITWVTFIMLPFFLLLRKYNLFRLGDMEEVLGLDVACHGGALPDAQEEVKDEFLEYQKDNQRRFKKKAREKAMSSVSGAPSTIQY